MGRKGVDFGEWDKDFDIIGWIKPALDLLINESDEEEEESEEEDEDSEEAED